MNFYFVSGVDLIRCVSFEEREKNTARRFEIMDTNTRQYRPYNALGRQITLCLIPPLENSDAVAHFLDSVKDLFEYSLSELDDADMVGIRIQN